jgi:hypothetical protein
MHKVNTNKVGLLVGSFIGGLHLLWSLLVAVGLAQPLVNFIFRLHMIKPFIMVDSFNIGLAITLVVITAIVGYVVGYILASIWNYLHR